MLAGNKVIVTVALNGGMQQDREGAVVPKQPNEIGEAAARCYEAGAAMVHVHARGPDGKNSGDKAIYAEIIKEIRARSPILIQTTNGIGVRRDPATGGFIWPSDKERLGILELEPRQDLFVQAFGQTNDPFATEPQRDLELERDDATPRDRQQAAWRRSLIFTAGVHRR